MKQTPLDVLLCSLLLGVLSAATLALFMAVLAPWFRTWCGDYHVLAVLLTAPIVYGVLSAVAIRGLLVVRPLAPGRYGMDSPVFTYWKLLTVTILVARWVLRPFTFDLNKPVLAWLFGAKIGRNVAIGGDVDEPFLLTLGDGAVLGHGSLVAGSVISDGVITLGPVSIGDGATVGANAVVLAGTMVGAGAVLASGSIVIPGTVIPAGEGWRGNPARKWTGPAAKAATAAEA
jgi:serine acetyltransferase